MAAAGTKVVEDCFIACDNDKTEEIERPSPGGRIQEKPKMKLAARLQ